LIFLKSPRYPLCLSTLWSFVAFFQRLICLALSLRLIHLISALNALLQLATRK
jgi:hypothetical protein